jgi:hypothetical protein
MLKPLDQILEPDSRYANVMTPDDHGGFRPMTLADHHDMVSGIRLSSTAPDEIRQMFDRSLHAALYAWFDYELTALAELQAYATLKAALRGYFQQEDSNLWNLTERAVSKTLFEPMLGNVELKVALTTLRNTAAHGSTNFGTPGMALTMIAYCARLIGRLYPDGVEEAV